MSQSLGNSNMHIVFSTKNREPLISAQLENELYAYICGICKFLKSPVYVINGMPDHVHILLEHHRTISLSDLVGKIKSNSSRWVKGCEYGDSNFSWQKGFGYFAVSRQQLEIVKKYILEQKEHHKKIGFQDEMRLVYGKCEITFDERYIWD
ncbi:MAG TPA: IS200/IS605 family transposase [Bacteroidia bacterium]|jgi:REP-associated tyrosine transposase